MSFRFRVWEQNGRHLKLHQETGGLRQNQSRSSENNNLENKILDFQNNGSTYQSTTVKNLHLIVQYLKQNKIFCKYKLY